jgi:hypothetical protein
MKLSVRGALIFSFLFWLASRLGPDYEALGNEGLNFGTLGWSCTRQLALWMWNNRFLFSYLFGLHQGLGLIMKHSVTGAWILWLWVEAAPVRWPCKCEKLDFLFHFLLGLHQGLGLIMKLSVMRAWVLGLWVEATLGSWPYECEMFDFFFHFFFAYIEAWAWLWSTR